MDSWSKLNMVVLKRAAIKVPGRKRVVRMAVPGWKLVGDGLGREVISLDR